jgi:hypothetical protein
LLPRYGFNIVARHFDPPVTLLADVVFGHVAALDRVKDAIDRRGFFVRARLAQAERGEPGSGTVVPGPDIAERGRYAHRDRGNRFAGRGVARRRIDE